MGVSGLARAFTSAPVKVPVFALDGRYSSGFLFLNRLCAAVQKADQAEHSVARDVKRIKQSFVQFLRVTARHSS